MGLTRAKITNVDTSIEMIADPITILNSGSNNANVDVGFLVNRANGLLANTAIYWNESGNSFITAFTSNTGGTNTNITVTSYANVTTGHLLPGANVSYDLGSSTKRWRTLYISGSTIVMGSSTISTDNSGNFSFSTTGGTPLNGQFATVVSNTINAATIGNTGTTLTGTISTAAQTNITSVGTLTSLSVGNVYSSGSIILAGTVKAYELWSTQSAGDEGGQINMAKPVTNTTLAGNVLIDVYQNKVRFFEDGGTFRGAFIDITGASAGVGTNLLAGGGGGTPGGSDKQIQYNNGGVFGGSSALLYYSANSVVLASAGTSTTTTTGGSLQVLGGAGFTGNVVADQVHALNNGNGTNFRIGDDTYLGDINVANTTRLMGQQDATQGYIVFGNSNATNYIGRSGTNPITVTGAFSITGTTTAATITSSGTITAATVNAATIGNTGATLTGTISTAAQTNITSVGTLTSLNVGAVTSSGTIIASTVNAATIGNTSAAHVGSTGTFSGTVVAATVNAATIGNTGATLTGTISTAAQTNITSVGNLTSVSIAGTSTHYGAASFYTAPVPGANVAVNLGSTTAWWSTIYGKATQAQYADLAENYTSDDNYPPGTVVVFGGEQEITVTDKIADTRVAGVISTNPAYLMNAVVEGLPVAFTGRVPCQVKGPINKGDVLVTSNVPGVAQRIGIDWQPGCVLGKALGSINSNNIETIEVVVGRF